METPASQPKPSSVSIDEFKKLDLRTAKVLEVTEHPQADRLWVVKVDAGEGPKQIVAGVRAFYTKEELTGKTVIVVNNLQPTLIRGVESNGMLLASKSGGALTILTTDRPLAPGSPVS